MGKDKRKRDRRQTPEVDSANNNVEINTTGAQTPLAPRGQRENRIRRQGSRERAVKVIPVAEKPATENLSEKKEETKEVPPDPAVLFANLKRETDDIKALTQKKFAKRQIFSNWSRYEEPLPDPAHEEQELPGADFEALCTSITSESNYFRLKSEHSWDTKITTLSSELFSLDANVLAASTSCIPFYERLDLPITLFSEADVQKMKNSAKSCKRQYKSSKSYLNKERDILNILRERSSAEDNLPLKAEREKTPDHKPVLCFTIDRPETPNELERSTVTEVCEQAHSMPPNATRFSADIGRKGSPEIVSKVTSKIPETNMTPQDFRTSRLSPEKQESELQNLTENTRHMAEISFNTVSQREERNTSPKRFAEDRCSPKLVEKVEPSGKEIFEEINGYIPEKLSVTPQRQSKTEKIKHFNNDAGSEMSSCVVQQSESGPAKSVEESIPEPVPETLPPKQMNKNKSKQKKKQHALKMATTLGTAADSEVASPQRESELKSETETVSNVAINEDVKPQEEVQKPPAIADSMGQRSKKRKSKEKGQHANKPVENAKMPTQDKPEITNVLVEKETKPVAQEIAVEKAKSPSPEKPFVKPHPVPQTKPAKIVNPKQEMVSEPVKVVQEKPNIETAKLKEEKPVPKVKSKEEKPIGQENSKEEKPIGKVKPKEEKPVGKVKPKEEKVKAPAQEKTVEKIKDDSDDDSDDLDFLLSLRKPVRESQVAPEASTPTSKPSIEKDDTSITTTEFMFSEKKQDLEDWLDSVLGD